MLGWLFLTQRQRDALTYLESFRSQVPDQFYAAARQSLRSASQARQLDAAIVVDRTSVQAFVLNILRHRLAQQITSGHNHWHRGVLSPEGERLEQVWQNIVERGLTDGYFTPQQAAEYRNWLSQEIAAWG